MNYCLQVGRLSAAIRSALQNEGVEVTKSPGDFHGVPGDWVIAAIDGCRLDHLQSWERQAHSRGMRFFPVHIQAGEAVIGPETVPGRKGCLTCWEQRFFRGRKRARNYADLAIECNELNPDPLLNASAVVIVAQIVVEHFLRISGADYDIETDDRAIYYLDLRTFMGREWRFIPDPTCHQCGALPQDSPERANLQFESRQKLDPDSDRLRPLNDMEFVKDAFIGHFSNIVSNRKCRWPDQRLAATSVGVPLRETRSIELCHGFCARYSDSDRVAILEAVERYCGAQPRAFTPSVIGSYSQLDALAVNPRTFGLHSEREYKANPQLDRYHDNLEFMHVWAYSCRLSRPVLVPLQLGFYTMGLTPGDGRFIAIEGSSGCSIGSSIEEAILHGIFEVAERDAYMLVWYSGLRKPSIDPMTSRDPECRHWLRCLRAEGFEITVVDATTDFSIPAILIVAVRHNQWPYIICASGAHLYPEMALKKTLRELYATLGLHEGGGRQARRVEAFALSEDYSQIRELGQHSLAHTTLRSLPHLEFLLGRKETISVQDMESRVAEIFSPDLCQELQRIIDKILKAGSDVLVVDQTAPEQRKYSLHTVKVLISGAVPPCWGDHRRRFEHLPRLDAAVALGHSGPNIGKPEPNPIPHPFI